jgi:hypothetical protein
MKLAPGKPSTFEETVLRLGLSPEQYQSSAILKEWARKHRNEKYVPPDLLSAWGLAVETEF